MAINKKGSRKIIVDGAEFRWRASGNDGWITVVIWPVENEDSRIVGQIGYHHDMVKVQEGHYSSNGQLVVTNRIVKEVILHIDVQEAISNKGQLNLGKIEEIYEVKNAVRS